MSTTYSASDLKVGEGWRYSEPQMKLRADALRVLMGKFGEGPYNESVSYTHLTLPTSDLV